MATTGGQSPRHVTRRAGLDDLTLAAKTKTEAFVASLPLPPSRKSMPPTKWPYRDSSTSSIGQRESFSSNRLDYEPSTQRGSSQSSFTTPGIETPTPAGAATKGYFNEDIIIPKDLRLPPTRPKRPHGRYDPDPASRRSTSVSSSSRSTTENVEAIAVPRPVLSVPGHHADEPLATPQSIPAPAAKATTAAAPQTLTHAQVRGKRRITRQKLLFISGLVGINFLFIFATWWWPKYYYLYLPFISLPLALNCAMIVSIFFFTVRNSIWPEPKPLIPATPENMVLLMPCYNETLEECTRSLDSLVAQVGIEEHAKAILIVCDGRVRGPGMEKTTGQYLNEDILVDRTHREIIRGAYTAWDGQSMTLELTRGTYKGVPFCCIVKQQNQGKRDSLIVARSFLFNFNIREKKPKVIFSPYFFSTLSSWLTHDAGMQRVDVLIGMDADTVFENNCIAALLEESHYPNTVGVCGYVAVDFKDSPFNPWALYQSAEYTIAQGLRRLHQSIATHKVSCLPGCCQLLRINEITCGDLVLIDKFGYHPSPLDGMLKQIRATASEDRNHVCLMLTTYPKAQTRQALKAYAYTDVPHSWSVFLSQRRRWTLGATGNDLLLVTAGGTQWWERILAFCNVLTWCLNVFVIASIASMVVAFIHQPYWIILAFASVMIVPILYYAGITLFIPRNALEKAQYLSGLVMFVVCGPFINISVLLFALWNMDSFGWGKTRKVIASDDDDKENEKSADPASSGQSGGEGESGEDWTPPAIMANDEESQLGPMQGIPTARYYTAEPSKLMSAAAAPRGPDGSIFEKAPPAEQHRNY